MLLAAPAAGFLASAFLFGRVELLVLGQGFAAAFYFVVTGYLLSYTLRRDVMTVDKLYGAAAAFLLGASVVIVGDSNKDRLEQARSFGCETVDVSRGEPREQIEQILGVPEVDCGVDCVGFEAHGHGARLWACPANLDLFEVREEDLIEECSGLMGAATMIRGIMDDECRVLTY